MTTVIQAVKKAMTSASSNASDLFVRCLENEGVDVMFGLPGEENDYFCIALKKSKSIRFVLTRHEQGAAFMASVYAQLTGKPGVCLCTLGPGATNIITGVADAHLKRTPLLVITGQSSSDNLHKESHQVLDLISMFKPFVKWNAPVRMPDTIPELVRKAFKEANQERSGACHIELSEDIAGMSVDGSASPLQVYPHASSSASRASLAQFMQALKESKQPVIFAGNGVIRQGGVDSLRQLVDITRIPVISTFTAKGVVSRDSPCCLFYAGMRESSDFTNTLIENCDLVIVMGYDMVEYPPSLWNPDGSLQIIHVDALPAEVDRHYQPRLELVGNINNTLNEIVSIVSSQPFSFDSGYYSNIRQTMIDELSAYAKDESVGKLKPQKVVWDLRSALHPHDILVCDVGAVKFWVERMFPCDEPNTCLHTNGLESLGFALPGAIAAKLAFPHRNVMAVCGDGGFLMQHQEMETAARLQTNVICVVFVDGGYGSIAYKQDKKFGEHSDLQFGNPDFVQLASSFGWVGYHVTDSSQLQPTLNQALSDTISHSVLISVAVDYSQNQQLTDLAQRRKSLST